MCTHLDYRGSSVATRQHHREAQADAIAPRSAAARADQGEAGSQRGTHEAAEVLTSSPPHLALPPKRTATTEAFQRRGIPTGQQGQ